MNEGKEFEAPTLRSIIERESRNHNRLCLSDITSKVGRLIGVHIDEMDLYYIMAYPEDDSEKARISLETMVGGYFLLEENLQSRWLCEQFEQKGSPRTNVFKVSADTREQFREMATGGRKEPIAVARGEEAVKYYDETVAPILTDKDTK